MQQGGVPCSPKAILKHVLTWKLWPGFFQRFGNGSFFTLFQFNLDFAMLRGFVSCALHI